MARIVSRSLELRPKAQLFIVSLVVWMLIAAAGTVGAQQYMQIQSFLAEECLVFDHNSITGDDRGGIALSSTSVFYTGDDSTGYFPLDLSTGTAVGTRYDGLVSDLQSGVVYTLAEGAVPLENTSSLTIDNLLEVDPSDGSLTGASIALSSSISLQSYQSGVFSGYGRIVLWDFGSPGAVYDIELPSGNVTTLPAVARPNSPYYPQSCENWAFWGVAESGPSELFLTYVTSSDSIARLDVATGTPSTAGVFSDLSDMCSMTVNPATNRWYFHHEGNSQFGGSSETIGYCDARIATSGSADLMVSSPGGDLEVEVGSSIGLSVEVDNAGPDDATGVGLSVSLPANLELVSATPSTGTCSSLCGDSVVCEFGDLNSGATAAVALQLEGVIEGDATVSFGVGGNQIDPNLGDNIGGRTVTVSGDRELLTLDAYDGPGDVDLVNRSPDYTESYGSVPVVLPGEVVFAGHGLALDPTTGEFFAILSVDDNASTRMLVTIDPRSGLATSIGETGDRFSAVAIDEVGTVFGLTGNGASESETLYELNRSTAVPTLIGSLANGDRGEALAFNDNDGLLYHLGGPDFFESVQVPGPVRNSIPLCRPLPVYSPLAATQVSDDSLLVTSWDGLVRVDRDGTRQSVNTNNAYSKGMVIVEAAQADLGVSLVDSADPAIVGDTFTYTATISNDGPNSITDLGFVMALPGQVDGLSATPSQGTCSLDCGSVNCNLGDITSGGLATVAIEVRALLAGMAAAEVRYSAYADPDGSNNSDEETTTIDDPPLAETPPEIVSLDRNASIRRLSPTTLDTIETVPITLTGSSINNANGMAKNPLTGVYWALLSLSGQEGRELVTVNPISGEATSIGDTGDRFAALAFDETGVLYGLTGNGASSPLRLYTLDTMDASPTLVLDLSMDLESNQGVSLAYNPGDGLLYVASTNQLLAVDPLVPSSSSIALCRGFTWGVNGATALDDENLLLASDYGDLYRMQIATGTPVLLGDLDHTSKGLVLNDPTLIFADGFESGDTSAWSSTVP